MAAPTYYPNMDLLRYILALGVIVAHFNELGGHSIPFFISSYDSVGGFFVLSGFLIYPSFKKHPHLRDFLARRGRRILPPYFFIVIACAIGLAAISTLGMKEYFTSEGFWGYLATNLTFLNFLHPTLPGVFDTTAYALPAVNGSLWTMKIEWCLYLSVPLVAWAISRFRWDDRVVAVAIILISIAYRLTFQYFYLRTGSPILEILSRQFFGQLSYFYMGVLIYYYRDRFRQYLWQLFVVGLVLYICSISFDSLQILLAPVAIGMMAMAISLTARTPNILRHRHNVSYEMYLFHFPIIQLLISTGLNAGSQWLSFAVMLSAVIALSIISHCLQNCMLDSHRRASNRR